MRLSNSAIATLHWFAGLLIVLGALSAGLGTYEALRSMELTVGTRAEGTVVSLLDAEFKPPTNEHEEVYSVVEFQDATGKTHTVRTFSMSHPPKYALGVKVPVFYVAENPDRRAIADSENLWLRPILLLIFGALSLLVGGWTCAALLAKVRYRLRLLQRASPPPLPAELPTR